MKKMKILLPTTGLDIGGAETHVISLAKELKAMGHYPIVTSNGGIYVKELEKYKIPHFYAPLNSRRPTDLLKSYNVFKSIVKKEKIDIIHTHGRIASLVSKIISTRYNIPFMTTAHAIFNNKGILKYLTFWGKKTIAISEDVKNHLIKGFGVNKDKINIITNGIDTDTFSLKENNLDLLKELKLKEDTIKILYISRLSGELAELAIKLIKGAPKLLKELYNIEIVIVGDGDNYSQVKQMADEIDSSKNIIKLLGKRTDIAEIINLADVVVSVGRTALEAMAVEKPVILAGGEGYMGLLSPENYDLAQNTNFTGRNINSLKTENELINELINLFKNRSIKDREALGKFGRQKVEKNFSINKMANQTVDIYIELLKDWRHFHENNR